MFPIKPIKFKNLITFKSTVLENVVYSYFLDKFNTCPFRSNYQYTDLKYLTLERKLKAISKKYEIGVSMFYSSENMLGEEPNSYGISIGEEFLITFELLNLKSVINISIYYNPSESNPTSILILEVLEKLFYSKLVYIEKIPSVYIMMSDVGGMSARPYNLNISKDFIYQDLDQHYGKGFENYFENLKIEMKERDSGFVLFSGVEGSGKTHTIKALVRDLHEDKNFIYIPATMIPNLGQPEFLSFLASFCDNMLGCKFVLILEDSEDILTIRDGENYNANSISNILNLTDGILKDVFNTIVVATTSSTIDKIDPALLRSGRILSHKEFKPLSQEQYDFFKEEKNLNFEYDDNITISDVYNQTSSSLIDYDKLNRLQKSNNSIGFNN